MIIDGVSIKFGIIDATIEKEIKDGIHIRTFNDSKYSEPYKGQNTIDGSATYTKIAYLEKDYFLLDGSFIFPEEGKEYNVGWESKRLSDSDGGGADGWIEYRFDKPHVSYGITLFFGNDGIPKDFQIVYKKYHSEQELKRIIVENNTEAVYINYDSVIGWGEITYIPIKVNAKQRSRLRQVVFGINATYTEDELIEVAASRRTDISGDYNDCGEFSFTFFNDKFDLQSIRSLSTGLLEWLRVDIWVKTAEHPFAELFGKYYSETIDIDEKGKIITVSGYDILYRLNETEFHKGKVYPEGRSLAEWAREVADDAGVEVEIAPVFENIITHGYITDVPHREAFRLIAEAGNGIIIVGRNSVIGIVQPKMQSQPYYKVTDDDIVEGGLTIDNPDKYLGVNVTGYDFIMPVKSYETEEQLTADTTELAYIEEVGLTKKAQSFDIVYGDYPVWIGDITIGSTGETVQSPQIFVDTENTNAEVTNIVRYADHISFDLSLMDSRNPKYDLNKKQKTTFITITGRPYSTVATSEVRGSDYKNVKEIKDNYLIDKELAPIVADYQYNVINRKYNYSAEILIEGLISLPEVGEVMNIQDTNVFIEGIGFRLAYGEYNTTFEGKEE